MTTATITNAIDNAQKTKNNVYKNITIEEIHHHLTGLGFAKVDLSNTFEVVYSKLTTFENAPTLIRIYTGVLKSTGQSRERGKDAIRVCLARNIDGKVRVFKTYETVRRTGTWRKNLQARLDSIGTGVVEVRDRQLSELDLLEGRTAPVAAPVAAELKCPKCDARMVGPKAGRHGPFYGCSRFPQCRGLVNA